MLTRQLIFEIILLSYVTIGLMLRAYANIDICPPCLINKIFGINCWGCGLTTAFIHILRLEFVEAFNSNWLIIIVFPSIIFFTLNNLIKVTK